MHNKLSILIVDHSCSATRQISIPKIALKIAAGVVCVAVIGSTIWFYDYFRLRGELEVTTDNISTTKSKIVVQEGEIKFQREQIQAFAEDMESLKLKFAQLTDLEKQIRKTTTAKIVDRADALTGMGGPKSSEMDAMASMEEKPSMMLVSMHKELEQLNLAADYQRKSMETLLTALVEEQNMLSATPSILPLVSGRHLVTSRFGYRKSPFTSARTFHSGLDLSAKIGTPIVSGGAGKVIFSGWRGDYGNMIVVDHGYGLVTRYAHCSKLLKGVGEKVNKGDVIAEVGNTGRSTGPHLHYEVLLNGVQVNPEKYIKR